VVHLGFGVGVIYERVSKIGAKTVLIIIFTMLMQSSESRCIESVGRLACEDVEILHNNLTGPPQWLEVFPCTPQEDAVHRVRM